MEFTKLIDHKSIFLEEELANLVSLCIFNPNMGKIQNASQALYSKTQGVFYTMVEKDEVVGIIGAKKIDGIKLELHHIAVKESMRLKGIARQMIEDMMELESVGEMYCEVDHKIEGFFKKCGFNTTLVEDEFLGSETYICTLYK